MCRWKRLFDRSFLPTSTLERVALRFFEAKNYYTYVQLDSLETTFSPFGKERIIKFSRGNSSGNDCYLQQRVHLA